MGREAKELDRTVGLIHKPQGLVGDLGSRGGVEKAGAALQPSRGQEKV